MTELLYTIPEVAQLLKTNEAYVNKLRRTGMLKFLKLGRWKCRKSTLEAFLEQWEGYDLTDPENVRAVSMEDDDEN